MDDPMRRHLDGEARVEVEQQRYRIEPLLARRGVRAVLAEAGFEPGMEGLSGRVSAEPADVERWEREGAGWVEAEVLAMAVGCSAAEVWMEWRGWAPEEEHGPEGYVADWDWWVEQE